MQLNCIFTYKCSSLLNNIQMVGSTDRVEFLNNNIIIPYLIVFMTDITILIQCQDNQNITRIS